MDHELLKNIDDGDDDYVGEVMEPEVAMRSVSSLKARDAIAHNLLHHGLAGTSFVWLELKTED